MKKIILALAACSVLAACDLPKKTGTHVEALTLVSSRVDDDAGELYATVKNDAGTTWEVDLGDECAGYPFKTGQQMLIRFDDFTQGEGANIQRTTSPQQDQVFNVLCGS